MIIRLGVIEDIPSITEIYNQAIKTRLSTCDESDRSIEERRVWFEQFDSQYPLFVGIEDEAVVAYGCLFRYTNKIGYTFTAENSVYIHQDFQGKGFGKQILAHLIEEAKKRNFHYIEAKIFSHNQISLNLHANLGFTYVGTQKEIAQLDGMWLDVILLAKHLNP